MGKKVEMFNENVTIEIVENTSSSVEETEKKIDLNNEVLVHIGVVAGERVPIITDRNPHLEVRILNAINHLFRMLYLNNNLKKEITERKKLMEKSIFVKINFLIELSSFRF